MRIQGSISLITGGCQGFGRAFSKELLKRGGKVAVVDINENIGQKVSTEFKDEFGNENVHFIQCDVTDSPSLEGAFTETISKFGRLDILCNNAGSVMNNWKKLVHLNLTSVIHGTFLGIKHMKDYNKGEGGLIVNMGSLSGLFPYRDAPVYSATKFGVVGFSQSLRKANVKDKIRVNCLCPSFSPTTMVEKGLAARPEMRPFIEKIGIVPIEDVAKGFLELVNDDSRDGEVLSVTVQGMAYVTARHDIVPIEPKL